MVRRESVIGFSEQCVRRANRCFIPTSISDQYIFVSRMLTSSSTRSISCVGKPLSGSRSTGTLPHQDSIQARVVDQANRFAEYFVALLSDVHANTRISPDRPAAAGNQFNRGRFTVAIIAEEGKQALFGDTQIQSVKDLSFSKALLTSANLDYRSCHGFPFFDRGFCMPMQCTWQTNLYARGRASRQCRKFHHYRCQ